jgi:hypothetical protein
MTIAVFMARASLQKACDRIGHLAHPLQRAAEAGT